MKRHAFTLIELLIVVAIIAILAAIAVPNFLEAQVRAKTSRAKSDIRTLKTALEAYYVDNNAYIPTDEQPANPSNSLIEQLDRIGYRLTTPIAYLTSVPVPDPFVAQGDSHGQYYTDERSFLYINYLDKLPAAGSPEPPRNIYVIISFGPDKTLNGITWVPLALLRGKSLGEAYAQYPPYDPTNGTVSAGDIAGFGGECAGCPPLTP